MLAQMETSLASQRSEKAVELWTVADLQRALKVSRSMAYDLVRRGSVRSYRIGSAVRVDAASVRDFLRESMQ